MFKRRCKLLLMAVSLVPDMPVLAQNDVPDDPLQLLIDTDGKHHLHIRVGNYYFEPDHIIVKVNVPIELSISREWGIIPHTFVLKMPESGIMINEPLNSDPKTFTFSPTVTGKFEFYCRNKMLFFRSHEEKGMKGTIEVVP